MKLETNGSAVTDAAPNGLAGPRTAAVAEDPISRGMALRRSRYAIQLPSVDTHELAQDEAYFYLEEDGGRQRIRLHDYGDIYNRPGLYEQLFYDRLKCVSPKRMAAWLHESCQEAGESMSALRVLDLGAGNGMMGEELLRYGAARIVGIDILPEAKDAADRDRPGIYDAYYVEDLAQPSAKLIETLQDWNFDCFTTVAALGFGDIPPEAFVNGFNLISDGGWICFNIKESFLSEEDTSGFSKLVRRMIQTQKLEMHRMVRYRHRNSLEGDPLTYYGIIGRKRSDVAGYGQLA